MRNSLLLLAVLLLSGLKVNAQTSSLPFLTIPSDARAGGMGDIGVSTSSDAYSLFHNPSKIAFNENQISIGVSYVPWLRNLVDDIFAGNISVVNRLNERSAWGADLKYFSLGEFTQTDNNGTEIGTLNPNEIALSGYYALKLSETFSMSLGLKYINSNLDVNDSFSAVNTYAFDISGYYQSTEENYGTFNGRYRLGFNFANIGPKVEYQPGTENFIPATLKLGGGFDFILDDYNNIGVNLEFRKLLVPANPASDEDEGFISGIATSFTDSQEFKEIVWSLGAEYLYNDAFAVRAGYFHESEENGNRQYFTLGAGFQAKAFSLDLSYLINASDVNNPLESTLRFSLAFDLGTIYEDY